MQAHLSKLKEKEPQQRRRDDRLILTRQSCFRCQRIYAFLYDVSIFYYLLCFAVLCRKDALIYGKGPNIDTLSIINCSIYDLDVTANNPVESAKKLLLRLYESTYNQIGPTLLHAIHHHSSPNPNALPLSSSSCPDFSFTPSSRQCHSYQTLNPPLPFSSLPFSIVLLAIPALHFALAVSLPFEPISHVNTATLVLHFALAMPLIG